jgi:hypothetical protein
VTYTTTDADNAPTARYKTITSSEKPPEHQCRNRGCLRQRGPAESASVMPV